MLADEFDVTSVYVRYNTGLHISTNGRQLAALVHGADPRLAGAGP